MRCVCKQWDALALKAIALGSALKMRQLPLIVPETYDGPVQLCFDGVTDLVDLSQLYAYKRIASLKFKDCQFTNFNAVELAGWLRTGAAIHSIKLIRSGIGTSASNTLADALKCNRSVTALDLSGNGIGNEGANAIAALLEVNTHIKSLELDKINATGTGVAAIATALRVNNSLTSLNISGNELLHKGEMALKEALAVNKTLKTLCVSNIRDSNNTIASTLRSALKSNTSITSLDISGNHIVEIISVITEHIMLLLFC